LDNTYLKIDNINPTYDRIGLDIYDENNVLLNRYLMENSKEIIVFKGRDQYEFNLGPLFENKPTGKYKVKIYDSFPEKVSAIVFEVGPIYFGTNLKTELKVGNFNIENPSIYNWIVEGTNSYVYLQRSDYDDKFVYLKLTEPVDFAYKNSIFFINKVFDDIEIEVNNVVEVPAQVEEYEIIELAPSTDNEFIYSNVSSISGSLSSMTDYFTSSIIYQHKLQDVDSDQIQSDFSDYKNFIYFGSAQRSFQLGFDKVKDYYYQSRSLATGSLLLIPAATQSLLNKYSMFTEYEKWMFSNKTGWPKTGSNSESLSHPTWSTVTDWYTESFNSASEYDTTNRAYLRYNIPQFYFESNEDDLMGNTIDMMGSFFDGIKIRIDNFSRMFHSGMNYWDHAPSRLLKHVLEVFGFENPEMAIMNVNRFYKYLLGDLDKVSVYKTTKPIKEIQETFYLRLLSNLPYIYKTKGTKEAIYALLNVFGIPRDYINPREYSPGPTTVRDKRGQIALDTMHYSLHFGSGSKTYLTFNRIDKYTTGSIYNSASFAYTTRFKPDSLYCSPNSLLPKVTHALWTVPKLSDTSSVTSSLIFSYQTYSIDGLPSYNHLGRLERFYSTASLGYIQNIPIRTDKFYFTYLNHTTGSIKAAEFGDINHLYLTGSKDIVRLDPGSLDHIIVEAWLKPDRAVVTESFVAKKASYETESVGWSLGQYSGNFAFEMSDGTVVNRVHSGQGAMVVNNILNYTNRWTNVIGVLRRGTNISLYVNQVLENTVADPSVGTTANTEDLTVGCLGGKDLYLSGSYKGKIARVRVYNFGNNGLTTSSRDAVISNSYANFKEVMFNQGMTSLSPYQTSVSIDYNFTKNEFTDLSGIQSQSVPLNSNSVVINDISYEAETFGIIEKDRNFIINHYSQSYGMLGSYSSSLFMTASLQFGNVAKVNANLTTSHFSGNVHEMRLFKTSLTAKEFESQSLNYRQVSTATTSSLKNLFAWWRMNEKYNAATTNSLSDASPWNDKYGNWATMSGFTGTESFTTNYEIVYTPAPIGQVDTAIDDKIYIGEPDLSTYYDDNRVSFIISPIDQINKDITNKLALTDLENKGMRPFERYRNKYTGLNLLRDFYCDTLTNQPIDYESFMKLGKELNTSVFEFIRNVLPERAILERGVQIKSHLFEQNKVRSKPGTVENNSFTGETETPYTITANQNTFVEVNLSIGSESGILYIPRETHSFEVKHDSISGSVFKCHDTIPSLITSSLGTINYYGTDPTSSYFMLSYRWKHKHGPHKQLKYAIYKGSYREAYISDDRTTASAAGGILQVALDIHNENLAFYNF